MRSSAQSTPKVSMKNGIDPSNSSVDELSVSMANRNVDESLNFHNSKVKYEAEIFESRRIRN